MDPSTLPEDIYNILSDEVDHQVLEKNVKAATEAFADILRTRLAKREERRGEDVLRFSSLGKKPRQIWYAANHPELKERVHGKQNFKFLYGDVLEILLIFLAKEAGHEVTHEQYEVSEDGVLGHIDCLIDGVPVDCKSASPYSYKKFSDGTLVFDDPFGYVQQLSGYAHEVGKTDRAGFLVADKVNGDICWSELDSRTILGNPPGPTITSLRSCINGSVPSRCYSDKPEGKSGNRKLGVECSYCSWKDECWKDSNDGKGLRKFFYSRGPVFLTHVAKEPKVDEG